MAHTFHFRSQHRYDTTKTGIAIPVELLFGPKSVQLDARLDTGASFCIFARSYAELLGIDIESGTPEYVSTANSTLQVFGHWLTVMALGFQIETMVYFAIDGNIRRNVLGRRGWIDRLRLCLIDHDGELYVSHYDDE
ncbi:MAG TPA: aspartyl protease family protein [Blastocatellia bacterium]|nr:aspartyl protease family protein [Blastocatellia bacterium]